MAPSALLKAMTNSKRKREAEEDDGSEHEDEFENESSSSESSDDEDNQEDNIDGSEDEDMTFLNGSAFSKSKGKGRALEDDGQDDGVLSEEENAPKRTVFKQKTLILSSRGITHRMRHMMKDIASILPHSKTGKSGYSKFSALLVCNRMWQNANSDAGLISYSHLLPHQWHIVDAKLDTKHQLSLLNELADLSNCSSALFFEARRHADLYLWASMTPNGPSVRFHLLNSHTVDELKMTGNCLKGSRPIVVFDDSFDAEPHLRLMKEVLMQVG